jgi:hypothetical protein
MPVGMVAVFVMPGYNPLRCTNHERFTIKEIIIMAKFMSSHTMPAGALKREQVNQLAQAALKDGTVKPYRSFLNLSEGKVTCIMEAPSKEALAGWFKKMQMPCDYIAPVELEGDKGVVKDA